MTDTPDPRIGGSRKYSRLALPSSPFPSSVPWPATPRSGIRAGMIAIDAVASEIAKWTAMPQAPKEDA